MSVACRAETGSVALMPRPFHGPITTVEPSRLSRSSPRWVLSAAMRARSSSEVASIVEARGLLGLTGPADGEALTAAFRTAVKTARPDHPDGDETRFRQTIAAWRLLQAHDAPLALSAPVTPSPALHLIAITPLDALNGGSVLARISGRTLRVRAPAGLRSGDHLRLRGATDDGGDLYLPGLIRGGEGLTGMGDDV